MLHSDRGKTFGSQTQRSTEPGLLACLDPAQNYTTQEGFSGGTCLWGKALEYVAMHPQALEVSEGSDLGRELLELVPCKAQLRKAGEAANSRVQLGEAIASKAVGNNNAERSQKVGVTSLSAM